MRDLNDLAFFAAVVTHGGYSSAARALDMPKSRLSRRVAALEGQLGVRLVERSSRRFKVTEVGHDVYRHARAALVEAEAIDEVAARTRAEPAGLVRVSCPLGIDRLLAGALPAFLEANPRLRVQVMVGNRRVDLIEEGVDIAIRVREALDTDQDLQVRIIRRTSLVLVASPALMAAHGTPATPQHIPAFPTVAMSDRSGPVRTILVCTSTGAKVEIEHEPRLAATSLPIIRDAAIGGVGFALLPEFVAREALDDGRLVQVLPDWTFPQGIMHLVFTSRRGLLPGVRAVIDFLTAALDPRAPGWRNVI